MVHVLTDGDKAQAQACSKSCDWYRLLDLQGYGEFVTMMKRCNASKDYTEIDNAIRENIPQYLYNGGKGKRVPVSEIAHVRRCIRSGEPVTPPGSKLDRNGSKSKLNPGNHTKVEPMDLEAADIKNGHAVNGQANGTSDHRPSHSQEQTRLVCWDLYKRGAVGETLIHTCLLLANPLVVALAKRLLSIFPKLLVDIYLSDQYYGENILHIAIVNEDPAMVKFLLDSDTDGIIKHERAYGVFFSCDDQNASRKDTPASELMKLTPNTNYKGYLYWGEYPLSFAACLGQEECLRLLFANGVDPKAQDHNGNTVLHMLVIHNKLDMFDLVVDMSSSNGKKPEVAQSLLHIKNHKGYTPLTLAAAMAHKDMYNHLIEKEREVYWVYGDVTCAAYPLDNIDSIGKQGEINPTSALHLIIHGDKPEHLEMVDGMVVNLLKEKWTTFLRFRFFRRMILFGLYFAIFMAALILRPGKDHYPDITVNGTNGTNTSTDHNCYLVGPPTFAQYTNQDYIRLTLEGLTLLGVITYLSLAIQNLRETGKDRFLEMLKSAPSLTTFYISCVNVILMVPGRAFCSYSAHLAVYEDVLAITTILFTAPYFLFFCRGFKMIGPFVTMIYRMLVGDLLRFFTIYIIFLIGFSQAMYIVHINYSPPDPDQTTPFSHPANAIFGMFYMSMGEFTVMYDDLDHTTHAIMGKFIFILYMVLVTLLLINMLIAMMGNTYTLIAETQKEWLRQWAHIVLAVEQTVAPAERLNQQERYSQPMGNGSRALAIRWHQTEKEKEELKRDREAIRQKQKETLMRHANKHNSNGASAQVSRRASKLSIPKISDKPPKVST